MKRSNNQVLMVVLIIMAITILLSRLDLFF